MLKSVASSVAGLAVAGAFVSSPVLAAGGYPIYGSVKDEVIYEPPPFTWSGVYLGVNAGFGWGDSDWTARRDIGVVVDTRDRFNHDPQGGLVGGHLGFNYQTGRFVWGLEGSVAGANIEEETRSRFDGALLTTDIKTLWSVTGRVGYDWGRLLTYAKGGYAGANIELTARDPFLFQISESKVHNGWTVGGGLEFLASDNLVLGVEYNYYDFGEATHHRAVDNDVTLQTVTARVSYKFDFGDRMLPGIPWK